MKQFRGTYASIGSADHSLPTASIQLFTAYISNNLAPVPSCRCQINRILL